MALEGPFPASRAINAERLVLLGWSRAILLQLAHPLIAAAIGAHSSFKGGAAAAVSRLRHTVGAMIDLTYGDEVARAAAIGRIRAIHDRVHGAIGAPIGPFASGTRYSAHDPVLLLWVHATLLESVVIAHDTFVGPIDAVVRDAYCAEAASVAIALGAVPAGIPRTWAALTTYLDAVAASGVLAVGDEARDLAEAVLTPPMRAMIWPVASLNRRFTIDTLPPAIRDAYGFQWTPRSAAHLASVARALRAGRRLTPAWIARWPASRRLGSVRSHTPLALRQDTR